MPNNRLITPLPEGLFPQPPASPSYPSHSCSCGLALSRSQSSIRKRWLENLSFVTASQSKSPAPSCPALTRSFRRPGLAPGLCNALTSLFSPSAASSSVVPCPLYPPSNILASPAPFLLAHFPKLWREEGFLFSFLPLHLAPTMSVGNPSSQALPMTVTDEQQLRIPQ